LWPWAWSRFPDLVHETLGNEDTTEVEVKLQSGQIVRGFPDARVSQKGQLVLVGIDEDLDEPQEMGPFSIEQIASVTKIGSDD
jgi:hypothetical protein